ncbi:four helix bundle protein [Flavobacterium capsici]|uniref:Four helix bundle protein n=1 Tax=Flavobacterium capsici TaxID=3075618 RepID=A0AA96J1R7_9FLAO|nr:MULTISPECIES: four helix bundle protein [unclassified Flavobacterium]WNM18180.1 four helix bundle protein [Flavobacterium sp. PMR2A8]WNM22231.1 four helix bundle protein [Flavobacterium sp. PMTSA4]
MRVFSFEKLIAWQKARELALLIFKISKTFPKDELFGLTSQMRRCSISISSNLAEGSGRNSLKDKARFTEIAYSSSLELLNQVILCHDFEYINENEYILIREKLSEVTMLIDGLYKSQKKNTK